MVGATVCLATARLDLTVCAPARSAPAQYSRSMGRAPQSTFRWRSIRVEQQLAAPMVPATASYGCVIWAFYWFPTAASAQRAALPKWRLKIIKQSLGKRINSPTELVGTKVPIKRFPSWKTSGGSALLYSGMTWRLHHLPPFIHAPPWPLAAQSCLGMCTAGRGPSTGSCVHVGTCWISGLIIWIP